MFEIREGRPGEVATARGRSDGAASHDASPSAGARPATERVSLGHGRETVIRDLSLRLPPGRFTALIGPNGSGKSTLLSGLARHLAPQAGRVLLDGEDVRRLPSRALARRLGLLPQRPEAPDGLTVGDLVALGRTPHRGLVTPWREEDEAAVREALRRARVEDLAERPLDTLSGGQRQRAWIAMALAQSPAALLLDEPTTFLDLSHQLEVLDLARRSTRRDGTTVVAAIHDLNQALSHADHVVVLKAGRLVDEGPPERVVTPAMTREVFGVECAILEDAETGLRVCAPLALLRGGGGGSAGPRDRSETAS